MNSPSTRIGDAATEALILAGAFLLALLVYVSHRKGWWGGRKGTNVPGTQAPYEPPLDRDHRGGRDDPAPASRNRDNSPPEAARPPETPKASTPETPPAPERSSTPGPKDPNDRGDGGGGGGGGPSGGGDGDGGGGGGGGGGGWNKANGAPKNATTTALAKARLDANRARVALTHASGKYIPPPATKAGKGSNELFKNPYLEPKQITGPRLPPPRKTTLQASRPTLSSAGHRSSGQPALSPPSSPFTGSYPTNEIHQRRTALPEHLNHFPRPPSTPSERLVLPDKPKIQQKAIAKPVVQNFEPPKKGKEPGVIVDFFGDGLHDKRSGARPHEGSLDAKKRKIEQHVVSDPTDTAPPLVGSSPTIPKSVAAPVDMSSVLFRKKAKPKGIAR